MGHGSSYYPMGEAFFCLGEAHGQDSQGCPGNLDRIQAAVKLFTFHQISHVRFFLTKASHGQLVQLPTAKQNGPSQSPDSRLMLCSPTSLSTLPRISSPRASFTSCRVLGKLLLQPANWSIRISSKAPFNSAPFITLVHHGQEPT